MQNSFLKAIMATITQIIVAFIFALIIIFGIYTLSNKEINMAVSLINTISTGQSDTTKEKEVIMQVLDSGKSIIKNRPYYGQQYGTITIESANINLPVFYGDAVSVLKNGVGHSTSSYMPGAGGSIIMCAHNSANKFRNLSKVNIGDIIEIKTNYGIFKYKAYDMQVVQETEKEKLPIQDEKEILMIFTCYPFDALGYTTSRYVIYSELYEWEAL